ncbi:MAG TPA: pyridoxamine 5'-phosphate oxidase family protein [Methylibium sp.]|uniref:pyridoxamine 5'-phosphate oxidase family protein n=1 Tax=Methylibium sp. TaxID=2067992 RepID=UPI002DB77FC7|nr:pyridoxamine 5'-phosphate oxidase family protein [Methylibium sp.]HEU4459087.1 pyridoxamine 5'-phosphate oxidase family protein [Methylibium sp.]
MEQTGAVAKEQLWNLIKDIKFGMLTTHHADGYMHSRPMTTQNSRFDREDNENATLWFFMSRQGEAVADLQADPSVCITYSDTDKDSYVCVSGRATISEDRAKKEQLWSPTTKAWFPGGLDDPDLALVKVAISHADYWDVKQSKLVQLWRMASAAVTGKPPTDMTEHGHVSVR